MDQPESSSATLKVRMGPGGTKHASKMYALLFAGIQRSGSPGDTDYVSVWEAVSRQKCPRKVSQKAAKSIDTTNRSTGFDVGSSGSKLEQSTAIPQQSAVDTFKKTDDASIIYRQEPSQNTPAPPMPLVPMTTPSHIKNVDDGSAIWLKKLVFDNLLQPGDAVSLLTPEMVVATGELRETGEIFFHRQKFPGLSAWVAFIMHPDTQFLQDSAWRIFCRGYSLYAWERYRNQISSFYNATRERQKTLTIPKGPDDTDNRFRCPFDAMQLTSAPVMALKDSVSKEEEKKISPTPTQRSSVQANAKQKNQRGGSGSAFGPLNSVRTMAKNKASHAYNITKAHTNKMANGNMTELLKRKPYPKKAKRVLEETKLTAGELAGGLINSATKRAKVGQKIEEMMIGEGVARNNPRTYTGEDQGEQIQEGGDSKTDVLAPLSPHWNELHCLRSSRADAGCDGEKSLRRPSTKGELHRILTQGEGFVTKQFHIVADNSGPNPRNDFLAANPSSAKKSLDLAHAAQALANPESDPLTLIPPQEYESTTPEKWSRRPSRSRFNADFLRCRQPFQVFLMPQALFIGDMHSHMCEHEVIGYLGGYYDPVQKVMIVQNVFPVKELKLSDDQRTSVEMDPANALEVLDTITKVNMKVIGWYHSHPTFDAVPSICDVSAQSSYQKLFSRDNSDDVTPYIGIIFNPYKISKSKSKKKDPSSATSGIRLFHTHTMEYQCKSNAKPIEINIPMRLVATPLKYCARDVAGDTMWASIVTGEVPNESAARPVSTSLSTANENRQASTSSQLFPKIPPSTFDPLSPVEKSKSVGSGAILAIESIATEVPKTGHSLETASSTLNGPSPGAKLKSDGCEDILTIDPIASEVFEDGEGKDRKLSTSIQAFEDERVVHFRRTYGEEIQGTIAQLVHMAEYYKRNEKRVRPEKMMRNNKLSVTLYQYAMCLPIHEPLVPQFVSEVKAFLCEQLK